MAILEELLVRLGVDMSGAEDEVDRGSRGITSRLDGLAAAGTVAGAGLGAAFAVGLSSAMDITSAQTKLQNQLGLTEAEAARAGDVAGDVFAAGFGGSVDEVGESLAAVASNVGGLGEVTDAELRQMTKAALGLADTFQFDVAESTQAVGTLIKAGLAKDGTEALDLLTATARKLPPAFREELPAVTKEYGEFFDQLGFTGPDMMGLLAEAAKNPLFEIDKVGDALKELSLRLADTGAVKEPLKELGLNVKDIQGLVNEGKGTQAFDQIITALKGVDDQTERTRLQAALFGGPGEDMGNTLLQLSADGAAAANGLDDVAGAAKGMTDNMEGSPAQQLDQIYRGLTTTLGENLAPLLTLVTGFLQEHQGVIKMVAPIVLAVAAALAVWAAVQWVLNSALLANPLTWIILGIVALIALIVMIATKTTFFQDAWAMMTKAAIAAWNWFWNLLKAGWDLLVKLFLNFTGPGLFIKHWDTIKAVTLAAWDWVVSKVQGGVNMVVGAIQWLGRLPGMVGGYFTRLRDAAATRITSLINTARGIPGRVRSAVGDLGTLLLNAGKNIVNGLISGITSRLAALRDKAGEMAATVRNFLPFSPAKEGPLSGLGAPEVSGARIAEGIGKGLESGRPDLRASIGAAMGDFTADVSAPSTGKVQQQRMTVGFEPGGGDAFTDWFMEQIRVRFGGDVTRLGEG